MGLEENARLLIVDDEERNRELLRVMLRGQYSTLEAGNGPAALALLEKERVDLVLLDVMMPEMSGYDVCRAIKERKCDSFLPVLLVTALSDQDDKNLGLQSGADDFLAKPVDRRELLLRVRSFLKLRAQEMLIREQLAKLTRLQTMKDDMVSLMVHDLRSPLSGVVALLNLIIQELPEGALRDDARSALRGTDQALRTLQETLQVRLLEDGHLPIRRSPVHLGRLLDDAVSSLQAVARRKRIELSTAVEGSTATASLDGELVRRAIENLLANALKYTAGGKDVSVVVRRLPDSVEVDVADRGPGIPAELKRHMFEKFGSIEAKKGGQRNGFGLGLYLVKLVAEGHAGAAQVMDREGGGAVFRVRLGLAAA
jgi:signal transduction histidine kinase